MAHFPASLSMNRLAGSSGTQKVCEATKSRNRTGSVISKSGHSGLSQLPAAMTQRGLKHQSERRKLKVCGGVPRGLFSSSLQVARIIIPQVNRFVFSIAHDMIVLASDRLRFLNLGCDTGHLSFEMSSSFTVQVPAQLDLLRKVTSIKAFKNVFQLLPKELDSGALDGEELLPIELLEFGTNPAGALEADFTSPSFKRVASTSAGSTASTTPPFRRVRLRQQRHRS